jgi:ADP-heptose:LPS heptosyltransferase/membrane-associated phospholipid phosphatase
MAFIYHRFILVPFILACLISFFLLDSLIAEHITFPHVLRLWSSLISQFLSSIEVYIITALISLIAAKVSLRLIPNTQPSLQKLASQTYLASLSALTGFLFTLIFTFIVKTLIGRARPFVLVDNFQSSFQHFSFEWAYHSMPSGNAATLGALACFLIFLIPKFRFLILPITLAFASLRIFAEVHHLSDVLVGFLIGYVSMHFATHTILINDKISKVDKMRFVDAYVGTPSCFALTIIRKSWRYLFPRQINPEKNPKNILFINFAELGAIVLTHSAISHAKKEFPDAHIYFLTFPGGIPTLKAMGFNDEHILTIDPSSLSSLILSSLKTLVLTRIRNIDTSINTEVFIRFSTLIAYLSGCSRRVGFHPQNIKGSYVGDLITDPVLFSTQLHAVDAYLSLVKALKNPRKTDPWLKEHIPAHERKLLALKPSSTTLETIREKLKNASPADLPKQPRFVILNANASDLVPLRRWPLSHYKTLALAILKEHHDVHIVLTGSPAETNTAITLAQSIDNPRVIPFAGETSFDELIALYSLSHLLVTNDSGPAHFASTTAIPTLVLFGPETPVLFGPVGTNQEAISLFLACSPCISPFNAKTSPCSDPVCMKNISTEQVLKRTQALLATSS